MIHRRTNSIGDIDRDTCRRIEIAYFDYPTFDPNGLVPLVKQLESHNANKTLAHSSRIPAFGGNAGRMGGVAGRCMAGSPSSSPSRRAGWGRQKELWTVELLRRMAGPKSPGDQHVFDPVGIGAAQRNGR